MEVQMICQQKVIEVRPETIVLLFGVSCEIIQVNTVGFGFDITDRQIIDAYGEVRSAHAYFLRFPYELNRTSEDLCGPLEERIQRRTQRQLSCCQHTAVHVT